VIGDSSPTEVDALMLLCDSAQSVGGKLYILGGGWSHVSAGAFPGGLMMALAIKVAVPWDRANERIRIKLALVTDQGAPVDVDGNAIEAETELELGRPPGLRRGTPLDASLALNFAGLQLEVGGYVWRLEVDAIDKARIPFRVLP
jgi:hypothetical protein